jgi:hypothetical protein
MAADEVTHESLGYRILRNGAPTEVTVEYRGERSWAIMWRGCSWDWLRGGWDWEPLPSSRSDEWLRKHRYRNVVVALAVAKKLVKDSQDPA